MHAPDPPVTELSSTTQDLGLEEPPAHLSSSPLLKLPMRSASLPPALQAHGGHTQHPPLETAQIFPPRAVLSPLPAVTQRNAHFSPYRTPPLHPTLLISILSLI